jgi:hypothetical protein
MDLFKIAVKLFVESDVFAPSEFVPVFHHWIQTHALEDHLMVDVADYAHVPAGPGTVLITSEANIHMDRGENRLGLLYVRKTPIASLDNGSMFRDRLIGVIGETLKVAAKLEQEPELAGRLKFRTDEISIRLNDRLLAPNTPGTFAAVKPDVLAVAHDLYGSAPITIEHYQPSPLTLLDVRVKAEKSLSVDQMLNHLLSGQEA